MKKMKLNKKEKEIEKALIRGTYRPVSRTEFRDIAEAVVRRKKDAVLNIRMNRQDLEGLKQKAKRMRVPYQTLIAELLHHYAA
ncbi:antitoxin [Elusimicrobiota bacterium]